MPDAFKQRPVTTVTPLMLDSLGREREPASPGR
jgi:hypothetical protein